MRILRKLDHLEEDYLRDHPEKLEGYLVILFEEYAEDGHPKFESINAILRVLGYCLKPEKLKTV